VSRTQRLGLIAVAVAVAIAAFVILRPSDDSSDSNSGAQPSPTSNPTDTAKKPGAPKPKPSIPTIKVKAGKPVGGVGEIGVDKGDVLRFAVTSDAPHEVHLHGYDISKDVTAGGKVTFRVPAKLDGIFEVELEDLTEPIAEVRVSP